MEVGVSLYHLSTPDNLNINDFIDPFTYFLTNCSINDDADTIINKLRLGALLWQIDLKDAFCLILVQPSDLYLLRIFWKQKFYVDTCLPLGLRSAPNLLNRLSTALCWILEQNYGVDHHLHYLDNTFTAGPADSSTCEENLHAMLALCEKLNVPTKQSKVGGPTTWAYILTPSQWKQASLPKESRHYFKIYSHYMLRMYKKRITIPNR